MRAGYHPKNKPTAAAKANPPITAVGEMSVGQPASADSTFDATIPSAAPASPPRMLSSADSDQELQQDMQTARSDRHADSDLSRSLSNRDQHDVHDSDAADQQRNRGDRREQQRHGLAGAFRSLRDFAEAADGKVIVLTGADVMTPMQELLDLGLRRIDLLGGARLDVGSG